MVDMTVEQVSEEIKGMVTELQKKQDAIASGLYTKADVDSLVEKMTSRIDECETKLNRAPAPATDGGDNTEEEKAKAFNSFLRKGAERMSAEEVKSLATDYDPAAGYLTTTTVSNEIIKNITEWSPIRAEATVETIGGESMKYPRQTGLTTAGWVGERQTRSETGEPTVGMGEITLREMYAMPMASQQQLDDSGWDVEAWLAREVGEVFGTTEATAYINGTGPLQPEGFMTNADVLDNYVFTGVADNVTDAGLEKALYGLKEGYVSGAKWFCKRATLLNLALLVDGEGRPLLKMDPQDGKIATLKGYTVVTCPDMPAVGAGTYPLVFGNMRLAYKIVDKSTVAVLRDPFTTKGFVSFYSTKRTGGAVVRAEALIPVKCATS